MAFNAGTVRGELDLDTRGFVDALKRATKSLDRIDKSSKQTSKGFGSFTRSLAVARDLMLVLPGVIRAVTAPLRGLFNFLKSSSIAAASFEDTIRKLSVSLALQGVSGVKAFTLELEEFAQGLQDTTAFSSEMVLGISQQLTILGVQQDQLKLATKAVLDYSAATGRDAANAASQFGKTLGGTLGELSEAFPQLKALTQAQLEAGDAFKFAGELLGGFSEQVANTTKGIRAQLINALGDLQIAVGDAINPVLDVLTRVATEALKAATGAVRAGQDGITEAFAGIARSALEVIRGLADSALNIPVLIAQAKQFVAEVVGAVRTGAVDLDITIKGLLLGIKQGILDIIDAANQIPGIDLTQNLVRLGTELIVAKREFRELERSADALKQPFLDAAAAAAMQAERAQAAADAIRDGSDQVSAMARGFVFVNELIDQSVAELGDLNREVRDVTLETVRGNNALEERLNHLREITGLTDEILRPTISITNSVTQAANATARLKNEASGAAREFSKAADAAGGISINGGAGAGGGGSLRRPGGSAGLDLSDAFSSLEAAGNARNAINRNTGIFGGAARRSARAVADQIQGVAAAQVEREFADFTRDLLSELSRLGILDPAARSEFISQRTAEAVRLGVLPPRNAATRQTSVFG